MNLIPDSWQDWAIIVTIVAAVVGVYWQRRKDRRETRAQANADVSQALEVKDSTIGALEKQNDLLEKQAAQTKADGEKREEEWHRREAEWREERVEMRRRIEGLENDYRKLVSTVAGMSYCAKAGECKDVDRGDRRGGISIKAEGTD